jgi:hypothetical protein
VNITTISVKYERTLNLGDYNSAKIGAEMWASLDEGEDAAAAFAALWAQAKGEVKAQAEPLFAKQSAKAQQLFAGLPVELQAEVIKQGAAQAIAGTSRPAQSGRAVPAAVLAARALAEDVDSGLDPRDGLPFGDK